MHEVKYQNTRAVAHIGSWQIVQYRRQTLGWIWGMISQKKFTIVDAIAARIGRWKFKFKTLKFKGTFHIHFSYVFNNNFLCSHKNEREREKRLISCGRNIHLSLPLMGGCLLLLPYSHITLSCL